MDSEMGADRDIDGYLARSSLTPGKTVHGTECPLSSTFTRQGLPHSPELQGCGGKCPITTQISLSLSSYALT